MISALISRVVILLFGTLYPAYASYKAVRTKNVKEYVKWMMYWIVFALFTCAETVTDLFLSFWFPFYYEIKVVLVVWLLSPATKGSSILYRNFVHPALIRREQEIDEYISKAKEQGYHTMLHLGSKGVSYATNVIMQTAIKGGGGIVNQLRKSYSLSDLSEESDFKGDLNRNSKLQGDTVDTSDTPRDSRLKTSRKLAGNHINLYFPEVDVDVRSHHPHELPVTIGQIRSNEDISSGYSSAELFIEGQGGVEGNPLMRTASVGATRARPTRGRSAAQPKKALTTEAEQDEVTAFEGWQQPLPPDHFASSFPVHHSGLPPQAFLSPEALQLILKRYIDNGSIPLSPLLIDEQIEQANQDDVELDEVFEDSQLDIEKDNCIVQSEEDFTNNKVNIIIKLEENIITVDDEQIDKNNKYDGDVEVVFENSQPNIEKDSRVVKIEEDIANKEGNFIVESKEKIRTLDDEMIKTIDSDLKQPSSTPNVENNVTEITEEVLTPKFTADSNISPNLPPIESSICKLENIVKETEVDEYFEDAQDNEGEFDISSNKNLSSTADIVKDGALDGDVLSPIEESILDQTEQSKLQQTISMESVDSGNDLNFEDSLQDVTLVTSTDSPIGHDRKGKYNKGRAPPPPDIQSEKEVAVEETRSLQSFGTVAVPDVQLEPTTLSHSQVLKTNFLNETLSANNKDNLKQKETLSIAQTCEKREVSPSPSQGKKDSSHFSRFLPKSGMSSLFSLWGPKEDHFSKTNRTTTSPIKDMFYTPSSNLVPIWTEYSYSGEQLLARFIISHPTKLRNLAEEQEGGT